MTARLTASARVIDGRQRVLPSWVLNGACFGCFPFWSQNVVFVPVQVPALEGAPTGGVQLDVDPRSAQVYVDGKHVGLIREFSGYYKHLALAAGPHLVTIVAPRYEPLTIPLLVSPGHTLTYRGTLARAYGR